MAKTNSKAKLFAIEIYCACRPPTMDYPLQWTLQKGWPIASHESRKSHCNLHKRRKQQQQYSIGLPEASCCFDIPI